MSYSLLRKQFMSAEDFKKVYAMLSEEEVYRMIEQEHTNVTCKAAMFTTWQKLGNYQSESDNQKKTG